MKIFYRISESSNSQHAQQRTWQVKLPNATKQRCLLNTLNCFPTAEITIFVDSITDETWKWLNELSDATERVNLVKIQAGSDAKSMRVLLDEVQKITNDEEIVLFQEDDYLYLPGSEHKIIEALNYAHYATGYLHPDKFWDPKNDMDVWMWGTEDLINTKDFAIFLKLREKGRALVQPLPSLATHCLKGYEAPTVGLSIDSWEDI